MKAWTAQNKSIAIPVYIFGSIGVLLILGWILWFIRRRYRRKSLMPEKDKDSRPNSILSFQGKLDHNTGASILRRDSQIVPFPNNVHQVDHMMIPTNNTATNTTANNKNNDLIELSTLSSSNNIEHSSHHSSSSSSVNATTVNNLADIIDPNDNDDNNSLFTTTSRRNTIYLSNDLSKKNNRIVNGGGTHRRGKSSVQ